METHALDAAMIAVARATDNRGRMIRLVTNPYDPLQVRAALANVCQKLGQPSQLHRHMTDIAPGLTRVSETDLTHMILLATLLREHIRAGNCK